MAISEHIENFNTRFFGLLDEWSYFCREIESNAEDIKT